MSAFGHVKMKISVIVSFKLDVDFHTIGWGRKSCLEGCENILQIKSKNTTAHQQWRILYTRSEFNWLKCARTLA